MDSARLLASSRPNEITGHHAELQVGLEPPASRDSLPALWPHRETLPTTPPLGCADLVGGDALTRAVP
jgi:hypothetical protein